MPPFESRMKSSDYDEAYWEGGVGSEYHGYGDDAGWEGILHVVERRDPAPRRFLDIGCSKGYMVLHALMHGYDADGCDISEYAISKAPAEVVPVVRVANVVDLPYGDAEFDVVHTGEFWEHMLPDELDRAAGEALRVLKPGGLFVNRIGIIVPENHPFRAATVEDHSAHFTHFTVRTREEWTDYWTGRWGLTQLLDVEADLDRAFADRDWVMRFFAYRKPEEDTVA